MAFIRLVGATSIVLLLRDFGSPDPNVKCDVNESNWPGVRVVRHGDDAMKSDSSKSESNSSEKQKLKFHDLQELTS